MSRFLPQSVADKYDLDIPKYEGVDQVVVVDVSLSDSKV